MTDVARFWEKVEVRGQDECWPWLGCVDKRSGHGKAKWRGRGAKAHRIAFELKTGLMPAAEVFVRHTCNTPYCVNPAHLIPGTLVDNAKDRVAAGYWWQSPRRGPMPRFKGGVKPEAIEDRLRKLSAIDPTTGCWSWTKAVAQSAGGHAFIKISGRMRKAHRVSYETFVGPIPVGLWVLHNYDNARCVNPDHLRPGTHADNMADMVARGRAATGHRNHLGRVKYFGSRHGMAKLTEAAVLEIRAGMSTKEAMRKFGVSKATVCKARTGFGWKHV